MFSRIINFVSTRIIIVLFLSFRKVPDQTFSKEAKMIPTGIHEKLTDDSTSVSRILINIEKTFLQIK